MNPQVHEPEIKFALTMVSGGVIPEQTRYLFVRAKGLSSWSSTVVHPHTPEPMKYTYWIAAGAVLAICGTTRPSVAAPHDLQTTPMTMADALSVERHSQESLNRLASDVDQQIGPQESQGARDGNSLQIPFLDALLDESGELNLPLGLTVYDAMGTTSVGFGSTF